MKPNRQIKKIKRKQNKYEDHVDWFRDNNTSDLSKLFGLTH